MQYLVGQMLLCLLVAALLGVLIGFAWWGMRLRQARERSADLEQRVSKLSGYPARLTDMEATHAAYVASKNEEDAKCKARIAELEPLAAKVPELQAGLLGLEAQHKSALGSVEAQHASVLTAAEAKHELALTAALGAAEAKHQAALATAEAQIAEHVQAHSDKDARLGTLTGRVADLDTVAKRVPLLEEQISHSVDAHKEKDEHLEQLMGQVDDLKAGHAQKDASLADFATQVEGHVAAHALKDEQIGQLNAQLEQRTAALAEQDLHREGLVAQVDQHVTAHADKDGRIAELAALAALVPGLKAQAEQHAAYIAELTPLKAEVEGHVSAHAEKDAKIAELAPLAALVPDLKAQVEQHAATNAEKDARIAELAPLAALLPTLKAEVEQHLAAHAEKDAKIAELAPLAALVPDLKTQVQQHIEHIGELTPLAEKAVNGPSDEHLAELSASAALVPQLQEHIAQLTAQHEAALAEREARIAELTPLTRPATHDEEHIGELTAAAALAPALKAEVDQHVAAHAEKDAHIASLAPLADMVPQLQAQLAEKEKQMDALLSRLEELQPAAANYADLHYEHNLASRKLRMAELGIAAHQAEIAQLNDRLLAKSSAAPLLTMAAAAGAGSAAYGFYDVNDGKSTVAPVSDHAAEFEKRIAELRSIESAKDTEITNLRSKLAEFEATPDPDARRQILFTAKNAEVTQLKGVLNTLLQPVQADDIATRAYNYAKDRGFQGGSETEDWLRAERDVHYARLAAAWESTRGGGTMY